jgi:hypothetical protein
MAYRVKLSKGFLATGERQVLVETFEGDTRRGN